MDGGGRKLSSLIDKIGKGPQWQVVGSEASGEGDQGFSRFAIVRRYFAKKIKQARPMRRGSGSALALGFLLSGIIYGAVTGGHGPAMVSGVAGSVGLAATDIVISGQIETSEQDVFDAIALTPKHSLLGFDANSARDRIAALPWVDDVTVRKLYPGQLLIELREKRAFAVWQKDEHLSVVRENGELISRFGIADLLNNRFSHLPHLVGEGAADAAPEILPLASQHPSIAGRVKSYSRVGQRRWDINLDGGLVIKLPEKGADDALKILASLQEEKRVLDRQLNVIDLRIAGRVAFRLDPDAAAERAKFVKSRAKAMKKAERNL